MLGANYGALSWGKIRYDQGSFERCENMLEARMRKLENRLANLMVLSTRASAQTLYYMTLPYSRGGFPSRPLKEEAFKGQWEKSRLFATQFLRNASTNFELEKKEPGDTTHDESK